MTTATPRRASLGWVVRVLQHLEFPHKLGICERLFGRSLAHYGVCWVDTAAGLPWKLDLASPTHRWIVYGKYEGAPFLDWARRFLRPDGIVVDSGANIGQMLLYLAQSVPEGRVYAFEPGQEAADWLLTCLEGNSHLPVELIQCALGAAEADMALAPVGPELVHGACNQIRPRGEGEAVRVRRLDVVMREQGVERIDLWKLDVEGYEPEAIAGAADLLSERRIGAIYAELGFGRGEATRRALASFGYRCFLFERSRRLREAGALPQHVNGLFLPG